MTTCPVPVILRVADHLQGRALTAPDLEVAADVIKTVIILDKKEQLIKGQKIALFSTLLILFLSLLKAVIGHVFDSPLLVADAWHSGVDILINLTSLTGLWLASRKKSSRFPYGLYRAETLACLLIGFLIIFVGFDMIKDGWQKLFVLDSQDKFPIFPIGAAIISCAVACLLAVKQKSIGKAIGSQALQATAKESFFDIFTSLFVMVGILLVYFGIPYIEGGIIMLIATLILKLGLETVWKSVMILMDANMDSDLIVKIKKSLEEVKGVKGVDDLKIRQSGPFKMVACIIKTKPTLTLYKSHEVADVAENQLLNQYQNIESVFIHVEPQKEIIKTAAIPVQDKNGLDSKLHPFFGRAPYFIIVNLVKGQASIEKYLTNEFLDKEGHIGLNIVKLMISHKINLLFISRIGEISFHMLKNSFVDIFKVEGEITIKEIIDCYQTDKLESIVEPNVAKQNF